MMWLCGMNRPDFHTIDRFRGQRLKGHLKEIFRQVVLLLVENKYINPKEIYTDGTKLELVANSYTFARGISIATHKQKSYIQLEELWKYTQSIASEELKAKELPIFQEIDSQKIAQKVEQIHQALETAKVSEQEQIQKKVQAKLNYARRKLPMNWTSYLQSEKRL